MFNWLRKEQAGDTRTPARLRSFEAIYNFEVELTQPGRQPLFLEVRLRLSAYSTQRATVAVAVEALQTMAQRALTTGTFSVPIADLHMTESNFHNRIWAQFETNAQAMVVGLAPNAVFAFTHRPAACTTSYFEPDKIEHCPCYEGRRTNDDPHAYAPDCTGYGNGRCCRCKEEGTAPND